MTPKEKAEELVYRMFINGTSEISEKIAKQCALIAVDEILRTKGFTGNLSIDNDTYDYLEDIDKINWDYWQQVKHEIEKL